MKTSQKGISLIKELEGLRLKAYKCPAGKWTIGYGHTGGVHEGMTIDEETAEKWLKAELVRFEECVEKSVSVPLSESQFSALVSFAYNVGCSAFRRSTLLKKLNAGDYKGAAGEFGRWIYGGGRKLRGLERRRRAERGLFES